MMYFTDIQQIPSQNTDRLDNNNSSITSRAVHSESKSRTSLVQQFSEIQTCPAMGEETLMLPDDENDDDEDNNPWAVKQIDACFMMNDEFEVIALIIFLYRHLSIDKKQLIASGAFNGGLVDKRRRGPNLYFFVLGALQNNNNSENLRFFFTS